VQRRQQLVTADLNRYIQRNTRSWLMLKWLQNRPRAALSLTYAVSVWDLLITRSQCFCAYWENVTMIARESKSPGNPPVMLLAISMVGIRPR
jgi:hypothetical protein